MSELELNGGCLCGAIRFECRSKIYHAYKCHCRDCQRSSGGGFMGLIWVRERAFRFASGAPGFFASSPGEGREVHRGFCPACGSNLVVRNTSAKGILFVVATALDDLSLFAPRMEIWTGRAQRWDAVDPALPAFTGQPSVDEMLRFATF